MKTLNVTTVTVNHGEDGNTVVDVDVIEELSNGITRRIDSFTVPLEGTFQDGADEQGMVLAVKASLKDAGVI